MGSKKHKKHKSENKDGSDSDDGGHEKPLKLVLKVGSQEGHQGSLSPSSQPEERSRHKHKKKKKKKSSEKSRDRPREGEHSLKRPYEEDSEDEDDDNGFEVDQRRVSDNDESDGNSSPSRRLRERAMKESDGVILKQMLNYLVKNLQNKDVNGFFAFPVTDNIAPGYSSIIINPMDFSTLVEKVEAGEYVNVMDFKKDFILMCNNAMTYNRPETIYYKEAKRLLHLGIRQLSKEKLLHLKKTQSFLSSITLAELGFDEAGQVIVEQQTPAPVQPQQHIALAAEHPHHPPVPAEIEAKPERDIDRYDAIPDDDLSPAEILSQAQDAAQAAKNALTNRKPKTDLGFLRLEDDGHTSMTILNPWNDGIVSSTQKVISLGDYMGKLKSGSGSLFKFKEDKRNKVCPETYLCYGPFSTHAPSYDSSYASCTKEDSDLLLHTYGGEVGVQYAKSVQKFVENAGISAVEMVDKLLDTLTGGQHSKSRVMIEEQKRKAVEEEFARQEELARAQKIADEAAAAKAAMLRREGQGSGSDRVQQSLNQNAAILSDLYNTQNHRLSQDPPPHLSFIAQPSDKEAQLANQVTSNLVSLARQVQPNDVVSTSAVRSALGISSVKPAAPLSRPQDQAAKVRSMSDDSEDDGEEDEDDSEDEDEEREKEQVPTMREGGVSGGVVAAVEEDEKDEVDGGEDEEEEEEDEDESDEEDMEEG